MEEEKKQRNRLCVCVLNDEQKKQTSVAGHYYLKVQEHFGLVKIVLVSSHLELNK
jgi:hypothetical protein